MSSPSIIRQKITEQIVSALEQNVLPWRRPWNLSKNAGRPANAVSKRPYSGINVLLLDLHNLTHRLHSKWFATFEQWKNLGGSVRRRPEGVPPGQWGCKIVFFRPLTRSVTDVDSGEETEKRYGLLREYTVFSVDQTEGTALDHLRCSNGEEVAQTPDFEVAEELIAATKADIRHGGNQAFYRPPTPLESWPNHTEGDYVQIPRRSQFLQVGSYYETLLHEISHWSEIRLRWEREKHGYAMGELIAEMSSCYLATELGIPQAQDNLTNHAAYLQSWLTAMRADSGFIFRAASQASRTADFLLGFRPQQAVQDPEVAATLFES